MEEEEEGDAASLYIFLELRSMEMSAYTSSSVRRASPWNSEPWGLDGRMLQLVPKPLRAVYKGWVTRGGRSLVKGSKGVCML